MNKCHRHALMLLSSSLPPQFLLPAWTTPQLLRQLQRTHSTWEVEREKARRDYNLTQRVSNVETGRRQESEVLKPDIRYLVSDGNMAPPLRYASRRLNPSTTSDTKDRDFEKCGRTPVPNVSHIKVNTAGGVHVLKTPGRNSNRGATQPNFRTNANQVIHNHAVGEGDRHGESNAKLVVRRMTSRKLRRERREEGSRQTHTDLDTVEGGRVLTPKTIDSNTPQSNQPSDSKRLNRDDRLTSMTDTNNRQSDSEWPRAGNRQTHSKWKPVEELKVLSPEPERELSLFEELFPEEAQKEVPERKSHEGWFPISDTPTKDSGFPSLDDVQKVSGRQSQTQRERQRQCVQGSNILILSCASKNLEESDFLRINPKGTHIQGWASGMMKVIPGRNPLTLAPNGSYILIFPSSYHAEAYKDSLINAHRNAQIYTPKNISSPLPPPPVQHHAQNAETLKIYTLFPPSQKSISIQKPDFPFRQIVQRLVNDGGYPPIIRASETPTGQKAGLVLLSVIPPVEGLRSLQGIKGFLDRDGRARNLAWRLSSNKENVISKVVSSDPENRNKWIVSFRDGNEARRFVRVWHRRKWLGFEKMDVRRWEGLVMVDDEEPIVNAELLW